MAEPVFYWKHSLKYKVGGFLWLFICCKSKLKKKRFFLKKTFYKIYIILQNINYLQKKMFLYGKKVLQWKFFLLKKAFCTEKNINENVKNIYLISKIYFYTDNICVVLQIKYKSFLNICSFCKRNFFEHKNIFVKTQ